MKKRQIFLRIFFLILGLAFFILCLIATTFFLSNKGVIDCPNKITNINIVDWTIALLTGCIPIWLFYQGKEEIREIEASLKKEIIARKDLQYKLLNKKKEEAEIIGKSWEDLYLKERENSKKSREIFEDNLKIFKESNHELNKKLDESDEDFWALRRQLSNAGIPWEEHDIDAKRYYEEAVLEIESTFRVHQDRDGKINGKTIDEILGKDWKIMLNNNDKKEIMRIKEALIKMISDEINKNNH